MDIGDGEAVVAVQAKQNWDRPGWIIDGDFQSTNGTSSIADPRTGTCPPGCGVAGGLLRRRHGDHDDGRRGGEVRRLTFEMGRLYVCDTTLEHTTENDAAFRQDDTPADFHGEFVSFVAGAAETTAAASACPTDELARFRTGEYRRYVERQLADRHGVAADDVEVAVGRVGGSDEDTRAASNGARRVAERRDPDDPDVKTTRRCRSSTWPATVRRWPTRATSIPAPATLDQIAAGPASGRAATAGAAPRVGCHPTFTLLSRGHTYPRQWRIPPRPPPPPRTMAGSRDRRMLRRARTRPWARRRLLVRVPSRRRCWRRSCWSGGTGWPPTGPPSGPTTVWEHVESSR